jgi:hypothetical protein
MQNRLHTFLGARISNAADNDYRYTAASLSKDDPGRTGNHVHQRHVLLFPRVEPVRPAARGPPALPGLTLLAVHCQLSTPEGRCQLPSQRHRVGRTQVCTRPVPPALEEQRPVAHVRHEHPGWHARTRPEAAPDARLRWPAVAVRLIVGVPAGTAALVLHVFSACLYGVLPGVAPRIGDAGLVQTGGDVPT